MPTYEVLTGARSSKPASYNNTPCFQKLPSFLTNLCSYSLHRNMHSIEVLQMQIPVCRSSLTTNHGTPLPLSATAPTLQQAYVTFFGKYLNCHPNVPKLRKCHTTSSKYQDCHPKFTNLGVGQRTAKLLFQNSAITPK